MKTKQLAYVLTKIFGLSIFVNGILSIASGIITLLIFRSNGGSYMPISSALTMPAHGVITIAIGFILIVSSRQITEYLFKDEVE